MQTKSRPNTRIPSKEYTFVMAVVPGPVRGPGSAVEASKAGEPGSHLTLPDPGRGDKNEP